MTTARASLCPLLNTSKPGGIGTEISDGPLAVHRLPLPQPAPLCTSRVIGAVGSMTMMSSSDMSVFAVGWTMCAGT